VLLPHAPNSAAAHASAAARVALFTAFMNTPDRLRTRWPA
jgi:hypothetical protein